MRSHRFRFGPFWLLFAAAGMCACGAGHDDLSKRLAAVQTDLTRLQKHSDRLEERLEALELRKESVPASAPIAAGSAATVEHPRLMVVKLEPGDESRAAASDAPTAALRPEDSAADQSPRPVIRVYGSRGDVDSGSDSVKRKRRGQE